jgi:hypothetical protein
MFVCLCVIPVDCVASASDPLPPYTKNDACSGGWPWRALEYVAGTAAGRGIRGSAMSPGLMNEANYPFEIRGDPLTGKAVVRGSGQCNFIPSLGSQFYWAPNSGRAPSAASPLRFGKGRLSECQTANLMHAGYGPMAVSMYSNVALLAINSTSGVFRDLGICPLHKAPNHVVVLLGWGQASGGTNYWLIQNSWGFNWFQQGRGLFLRNPSGNIIPGASGYPHGNATCSLFSMAYWMPPSISTQSTVVDSCRVA